MNLHIFEIIIQLCDQNLILSNYTHTHTHRSEARITC